ncbi:fructose-1,6-bisphosphatase/inositol monophosphatase family enzyme [Catenuloplanes atrovinosus]|uniref:Fructose-1,6-bisphosphatase/inositol monophosphatase family enzyme n=1 Tax=Catenuloplanes atrovinosus TaxID=137266 RepID=A0AAE3YTC4_9ACTN|nr:fructose-1,6-bisphosphatase/inositol monophosphatase family enzyme [Catenuloplanes atrovinosus]
MSELIEQVGDLVREAAQTVVLPLFKKLDASDVHEKAPGDLVTIADQRSEKLLTEGLLRLLPGSTVVGEESVAEDPGLLRRICETGPVWLVDPLDGTGNFTFGRTPFAVMAALIQDGDLCAGWILDVTRDRMAVAERGSGAWLDGARVTTRADPVPATALRGAVMMKYLPEEMAAEIAARAGNVAAILPSQHCAGAEYPDVVSGAQDFVLFWKTLPWDHAPGVLFTREAGGVARRLDGTEFQVTDPRKGLLVAANPDIWADVRQALLGSRF